MPNRNMPHPPVGTVHQRHSPRARSSPQNTKMSWKCQVHRAVHAAQPSPAPVVDWGLLPASALVFFRSQAPAVEYALPIRAA